MCDTPWIHHYCVQNLTEIPRIIFKNAINCNVLCFAIFLALVGQSPPGKRKLERVFGNTLIGQVELNLTIKK